MSAGYSEIAVRHHRSREYGHFAKYIVLILAASIVLMAILAIFSYYS